MAFPTASPPCFSNLHHHTGRYCYNRLDTDVEAILAKIARRAQEHFTAAAEQ